MGNEDQSSELQRQVLAMRRFNRFYTGVVGVLNEMYLGAPVGLGEARIVYEIIQRPGCKAMDLIKRLNMDRGYVSRILTRLEKLEFITRQPSPDDGRVLSLHPTPAGIALIDELSRRANEQLGNMLGHLSPSERTELIKAMERIQELLSR
jgi:DNA-binding MarR family transcriptional regulator